ncbi:MAG: MOSC domain-containing protein [Oscillatoriales cyanobacterium CG2_30_44_21]|nr:MAG: MOSC domain-containing protein [Oscillatoriales cyanobacterium CG2_30_44_21]
MAKLSKILIFPIKSLSAIALNHVEISAGGALKGDREFALFDRRGQYFNAKRSPKFHLLRTSYDLLERLVNFQHNRGQFAPITFHLEGDRQALTNWFSEFFEQALELKQNTANGFPDDPEAWGATVIAEASLKAVQSWYADVDLEQIRARFRTNLEVDQTEAFWEDQLLAKSGEVVPFKIGDVQFWATNPCQRCPVPTRDSFTGEIYADFQKIFSQQRELNLSANTERSRFNHFYRLALNTQIPLTEAGKVLKLGDLITH